MRYHFEFVRPWKTWFIVSGLLVILALGAFFIRGLNYGIDFTGGTQMNLRFTHPVTATAIKTVLTRDHIYGSTVVFVGKGSQNVLITTPTISEHERTALLSQLGSKVGHFHEISTSRVSSIIGRQTERTALIAVLLAIVAIIAYIAIRFEWRFALSGIIAMIHDVIITVGLIALIHIQITEYFIMAVLTIFGYSITDKIIVFDRIRENLPKKKKQDALEDLVNKSLNQVLVRSINTSTTVIIALLALLIFAGTSIRDFALTMLFGVIFGTYSSIFIASPIWLLWRKRDLSNKRKRTASA
ncbi:MAG: protein translocase subunit SecF [Firmicutes bacterium]|uniref:Protein-export membrane protein SecF n=1 Tax=Sulfobacillus benefaciens TaxID=453960 RepID=A0A2T2WX36_9FIRM|nr:protein translocase subunit SecF [Bacillota bacterium]MCL5014021.1 protein translocase subunit SecF [Bacillota bacterium]PSR26793.1 MAG: protein translocase subunit SecF [Sulfobacillus benefaciens]HBQ93966.1 protein translocase subunit SecF [Sulfobacillus sp.]